MWNYHSKSNTQLGKAGKTPWPTVRPAEDIPSITNMSHSKRMNPSSSTRKSIGEELEILEVSRSYTVAPAYNKGAYQVISKENIKYIGK
jgi:hypothetical protein|tara:strand:- start:844 stop:1110 length:267 start_codon:yes stop_codon:yes gene_type:complete